MKSNYILLCTIFLLYVIYCTFSIFKGTSSDDIKLNKKNFIISKNGYNEKDYSIDIELNKEDEPNCETIHLALVCGGFNSTRNLYILLKSILFFRTNNNIQLHLLVDNNSRLILKNLFNTWQASNLNYNFYNISDYEHLVSWIPSRHYSHRYGLMKLDFLSIIADKELELSKIILMDTDMLSIGNIKRLWNEFDKFCYNDSKIIFAMVENQSDWYLGNGTNINNNNNNNNQFTSVWPAIGRGFNSGLILVNLNEVREQKWQEMWRQVAEKELITFLSAPLADQDIFNSVIKLNNNSIYKLPCLFNIQLNTNSKLDELCPEAKRNFNYNLRNKSIENQFQMIHLNSKNKLINNEEDQEGFYQNWYTTFTNWNGKLLKNSICEDIGNYSKTKLFNSSSSFHSIKLENSICKDIRPHLDDKLRTHLYYLEFDYQLKDEFDITYVVHLSFDRIQLLDELALHWQGPISAAIYLYELESELFLNFIQNSENLLNRKNISYHLVYRDEGFNYPTNRLRNIALENAITPYVVLSDIDLLPSYDLYSYLRSILLNYFKIKNEQQLDNSKSRMNLLYKKALVLPAFEMTQYKFDFPKNKQELLEQLNLNYLSIFRQQLWPRGQAATNYLKWKNSNELYEIDWQFDYEPFIVTSKNVIKFDERFIGFGFNKVEHIMELASENYKFIVLPEAFLIHKYHSPSYDLIRHRNSYSYRQCIKHLKRLFLMDLKTKKPIFFDQIIPTNTIHNTTLI